MTYAKTGTRLFFAACLMLACNPVAALAQSICQQELASAETAYTQGNFDETIRQVDLCLNKNDIAEADRRLGFRLKGLSYIGKGLESDAREAVRRLIELVPNFRADPIQDPPAFAAMIEEVRQTNTGNEGLEVASPSPPLQKPVQESKNRRESFYTNWGFGFPFIQYPDELDETLNQIEDFGFSRTALMLDLLGFYVPIGNQLIVGTALNAWGDRYELDGDFFDFTAYTAGASAMYFFEESIGEGIFLRADVGGARLVFDTSEGGKTTSDWGLGFRIGGGYGIPVSRETRILLHVNYSRRSVEDEPLGNFNLSVSGLF